MRFAAAHVAGVGIGLGVLGAPPSAPAVALVGASPVVIEGSGYTAGAKFYVTYRSGTTQVRRNVVASVAGKYRVVLKGVVFKRCDGLRLTAPGASFRLAPCKKR